MKNLILISIFSSVATTVVAGERLILQKSVEKHMLLVQGPARNESIQIKATLTRPTSLVASIHTLLEEGKCVTRISSVIADAEIQTVDFADATRSSRACLPLVLSGISVSDPVENDRCESFSSGTLVDFQISKDFALKLPFSVANSQFPTVLEIFPFHPLFKVQGKVVEQLSNGFSRGWVLQGIDLIKILMAHRQAFSSPDPNGLTNFCLGDFFVHFTDASARICGVFSYLR